MAKKILIATMVLAAALGGMAFGRGQNDSTPDLSGPATTGEKLTLSGTVKVTNLIHPVLSSGGKDYFLMVPHFLTFDSGVKDGSQVKIEGYKTTDLPRFAAADDKNTYVWVTKATVDGKDYDLTSEGGGYGMGGRGGMMGGNDMRSRMRTMDNRGAGSQGGRGGMMGGRR